MSEVELIYPVGLCYDRGGASATVTALQLCVISKEHIVADVSRIVLTKKFFKIPATFNLYVTVSTLPNEDSNVSHVVKLLRMFLEAYEERRREKMETRTDPVYESSQPAFKKPNEPTISLKLLLAAEEVRVSCGSFYEHLSTFKERTRHIACSHSLYRCKFNNYQTWRAATDFLITNAEANSAIYSVPVGLQDDGLRFTFDMYFRVQEYNAELQRLEKKRKLAQKLGGSKNEGFFRGSWFMNEFRDKEKKVPKNCDERFLDSLRGHDNCTRDKSVNKADSLFDNFSMHHWCLLQHDGEIITRVNEAQFGKLVTKQLSGMLFNKTVVHQIFETPMSLIPYMVWDIETVAAHDCTVPHGVRSDEQLASVAVVVDVKHKCRIAFVFTYLPPGCNVGQIEYPDKMLKLLDAKPVTLIYRSEPAMLYDYCCLMMSNVLLLHNTLGVKLEHVGKYNDVASFLVGHNSVGYDFEFIINRCLFFGMKDLVTALVERIVDREANNIVHNMYTFHSSQMCVDTMLFMQKRFNHLPNHGLRAVLGYFKCEISKMEFDSVDIRRFYNTLAGNGNHSSVLAGKLGVLNYLTDYLTYNVFDCLSLCNLLQKLDFAGYVTTLGKFFGAPLESVLYRKNCALLPYTLISLAWKNGRQIISERSENVSNFVPMEKHLVNLSEHVGTMFTVKPNVESPLFYAKMLDGNSEWMHCSEKEDELLRSGERAYVGGMNYASPAHVKFPILMDFTSYYPSIIRAFQLDYDNVFVTTVSKILMLFEPQQLNALLQHKVLQLFDYTSVEDAPDFVANHDEWFEGWQFDNAEKLVQTSKNLQRRVLGVMLKSSRSVVEQTVTEALERRAVWKRKKKLEPDNRVFESRDLLEKLLANGTYGYLEYEKSVVRSRATAAAVTLLCRNTFHRTRKIIESPEFVEKIGLNSEKCRARVVYIDTDGCIVVVDDSEDSIKPVWRRNGEDDYTTKTRIVKLVNEMLNIRYVNLASEEEDSIAATVFATKKYYLYKVGGKLKMRGFEANAPQAIKEIFRVVLTNFGRLNNDYELVRSKNFVCKIANHRGFLFALFDTLYNMWNNTEYRKSFNKKIPLNDRSDNGELSQFIKRTIENFGYPLGGRVNVMKFIDKGKARLERVKCCDGKTREILNLSDSDYKLVDSVDENDETLVPDFTFVLGSYTTYLYQCIEGRQTLREGLPEPVLFANEQQFHAHVNELCKKDGLLNSLNNAGNNVTTAEPLYLNTLQNIVKLVHALWLCSRFFRTDIRDDTLIAWRTNDIESLKTKLKSNPGFLTKANKQSVPPELMSLKFLQNWNRSLEIDDVVRSALFENVCNSPEDKMLKEKLLVSANILYKLL